MEYRINQISHILGIKTRVLQDWTARGYIRASVHTAERQADAHIFSEENLIEIAIFMNLMQITADRKMAAKMLEEIRKAKQNTSILSYHFAAFKIDVATGSVHCLITPHRLQCATFLPDHTLIIGLRKIVDDVKIQIKKWRLKSDAKRIAKAKCRMGEPQLPGAEETSSTAWVG